MNDIMTQYHNNTLKIKNKNLMYDLMKRHLLGNTFRIFDNEKQLLESSVDICGIRMTGRPGLPCIPWIDKHKAFDELRKIESKTGYKGIVCECDAFIPRAIQGELQYLNGELYFYYTYNQKYMRQALIESGKHARGFKALQLLINHLNDQSFDDIIELLDKFPGHVIELTVYNDCVGFFRGRNYVVWEVRYY